MARKSNYALSYKEAMQLLKYSIPDAGTDNQLGAAATLATFLSFRIHHFPINETLLFYCSNTAYQLGVMAGKKTEHMKRRTANVRYIQPGNRKE